MLNEGYYDEYDFGWAQKGSKKNRPCSTETHQMFTPPRALSISVHVTPTVTRVVSVTTIPKSCKSKPTTGSLAVENFWQHRAVDPVSQPVGAEGAAVIVALGPESGVGELSAWPTNRASVRRRDLDTKSIVKAEMSVLG